MIASITITIVIQFRGTLERLVRPVAWELQVKGQVFFPFWNLFLVGMFYENSLTFSYREWMAKMERKVLLVPQVQLWVLFFFSSSTPSSFSSQLLLIILVIGSCRNQRRTGTPGIQWLPGVSEFSHPFTFTLNIIYMTVLYWVKLIWCF